MLIPFSEIVKKYGKPNGILHVGANIGEEAEAYAKEGCNDVIWIEARESAYQKLILNVAPRGHRAIKACVSNVTGEKVEFNISNNDGQSSSFLQLGTHKQAHPEVDYIDVELMETVRIDDMAPYWGICNVYNFLNMDLQGAELLALKGMGDLLLQFKYAYLEINKKELYKGCALWPEVQRYMNKLGFKTKEIRMAGNAGWGDALMIKR